MGRRDAREIADDVLFPAADEVDRADRVPAAHFDLLAAEGFYGLSGFDELAPAVEAFACGDHQEVDKPPPCDERDRPVEHEVAAGTSYPQGLWRSQADQRAIPARRSPRASTSNQAVPAEAASGPRCCVQTKAVARQPPANASTAGASSSKPLSP